MSDYRDGGPDVRFAVESIVAVISLLIVVIVRLSLMVVFA